MTLLAHDVPIDLTNCDREPIHVPGQIQAHGVMFAVDRKTLEVVQVSENVADFVGRDVAAMLGSDLGALLEPHDRASLRRILDGATAERNEIHAFHGSLAGQRSFDVSVYADGPIGVIEAERATATAPAAPDFYTFASMSIARLRGTATSQAYCDALASAIRDLTGYDRVMIYRFAEDWSGHVIAESMTNEKGLGSFLDLHYPASDIPAQARALFAKNAVRMLPDAQARHARLVPEINPRTNAPLDMSHAFLRGASPMYTEYLDNMGVRATLTLALTDHDSLWGLVACHHYGEPRAISHGLRVACELLSNVASLQIADKLRGDDAAYRGRIQSIHSLLVEAMAGGDTPVRALAQSTALIRGFVACSGIAIVSKAEVHVDGAVPSTEHLRRLAVTLSGTQGQTVVATERLGSVYEDADSLTGTACGLLAVPLSSEPGEYIFWFRPELIRTVTWAGDPTKPVSLGPRGDRLTPRKSFELWAETVRSTSEPWTRVEVDAARRLRTAMTELVLHRNRELERLNQQLAASNAELNAFAYAASHDLKEPLRGIYNHAELLRRDAQARLEPDDERRLDSIGRLSLRMRGLIDSLLEYSQLGQQEVALEQVVLGTVLTGVVESLARLIEDRKARVRVMPGLPIVRGVARFYEQIFANLISNAVKYNDSASPQVDIGCVRAGAPEFPEQAIGAPYAFFVRDDGIGIPVKHREVIFRIFKRLHTQDRYGGGTGAGLTIVKKLVERLDGKLWIESEEGSGTTMWFSVPREDAQRT